MLFIGGPADGHEIANPGIDVPEIRNVVYIRRRFTNPNTKRVRSVFAPADMRLEEVERRLADHLLRAWVNEAPDGSAD